MKTEKLSQDQTKEAGIPRYIQMLSLALMGCICINEWCKEDKEAGFGTIPQGSRAVCAHSCMAPSHGIHCRCVLPMCAWQAEWGLCTAAPDCLWLTNRPHFCREPATAGLHIQFAKRTLQVLLPDKKIFECSRDVLQCTHHNCQYRQSKFTPRRTHTRS